MIEKNLHKAGFTRLLKLYSIQTDRLLDLNHETKLEALKSTLYILGKAVQFILTMLLELVYF